MTATGATATGAIVVLVVVTREATAFGVRAVVPRAAVRFPAGTDAAFRDVAASCLVVVLRVEAVAERLRAGAATVLGLQLPGMLQSTATVPRDATPAGVDIGDIVTAGLPAVQVCVVIALCGA